MRRFSGEYFSLTMGERTAGVTTRMACVVSKKVAVRANARNLIKRRCRNIVRPHLSSLGRAHTLVFQAKREAAKASFAELKRDILKLLARVE